MSKKIKKLELSEEDIESEEEEEDDDEEIELANKKIAGHVQKWIGYDDKIREIQTLIKNLKVQKKKEEENIIKIMNKYDVENTIKISDGKLIKNVSKTKGGLKPDIVESALTEFMKNPVQAKKVTEFIMDKRVVKEREYLKRTRNRDK